MSRTQTQFASAPSASAAAAATANNNTSTTTKQRFLKTPVVVSHENYGPASLDVSRGKGYPSMFQSTPSMKQYTWEEVAQHNSESSAWVYIGNQVYDITPWLDHHPGGKEILLLCAGRDISDLFITYHPFTDKAAAVIAKYQIGEIKSTEFPQFAPDRGFYQECRQVVGEYFRSTGKDHKDPFPGLWRLAMFLTTAFICYVVLHLTQMNAGVKLLAAIVFGVCQALPLLHSMHDASHLAIGSTPVWWRTIGRLCMDWFAGASLYSWYNQHTIGHHVYTNIMGADPDLPMMEKGDMRRITPYQESSSFYRYQHYYLMFLYGFLGLKFRIQDITGTIIDGTNAAIRVNQQSSYDLFLQFVTKSWWAFYRLVLPIFVFHTQHNMSWWEFWGYFFVSEMMTGYYLAFNFQVSHVSPNLLWPDIHQPLSDEWAINQLQTSVDYNHGSWVCNLACGALNYQSIHHLFPSVSQYHYPAIAPLIQSVCKKYGVRYNYLPTFWQAFKAHVAYLKEMGQQGKEVHAHY